MKMMTAYNMSYKVQPTGSVQDIPTFYVTKAVEKAL